MNAMAMPFGPSSVPSAANSLTSPAPVAPITWPGSISASPTANPKSAWTIDTVPFPVAASIKPAMAMPSVSGFGIRRVYRSTTALDAPLLATALTSRGSEILSNVVPENRIDRVSHGHHRAECDDRNQDYQQPVLQKVLPLVLLDQPSDYRKHLLHKSST